MASNKIQEVEKAVGIYLKENLRPNIKEQLITFGVIIISLLGGFLGGISANIFYELYKDNISVVLIATLGFIFIIAFLLFIFYRNYNVFNKIDNNQMAEEITQKMSIIDKK